MVEIVNFAEQMNAPVYELTVDTGAVTVPVKDKKGRVLGEFEFVPTDSNLLKRTQDVVDHFNSVKEIPELEAFADDVCEQFDHLFGDGTADGIFRTCGPLTVLENGDFFFEHVLSGITGLVEQTMKQRIERKLRKVKALTKGYKK